MSRSGHSALTDVKPPGRADAGIVKVLDDRSDPISGRSHSRPHHSIDDRKVDGRHAPGKIRIRMDVVSPIRRQGSRVREIGFDQRIDRIERRRGRAEARARLTVGLALRGAVYCVSPASVNVRAGGAHMTVMTPAILRWPAAHAASTVGGVSGRGDCPSAHALGMKGRTMFFSSACHRDVVAMDRSPHRTLVKNSDGP